MNTQKMRRNAGRNISAALKFAKKSSWLVQSKICLLWHSLKKLLIPDFIKFHRKEGVGGFEPAAFLLLRQHNDQSFEPVLILFGHWDQTTSELC